MLKFKEILYQRTIKRSTGCTGIGLHSGDKVKIVFHPAPVDHGVIFKVNLGKECEIIKPSPFFVCDTSYATCIGNDKIKLCTVEHLLATLRGLSIDNILIEVYGNEIPIMDGSGASFVYLLKESGIVNQSRLKRFYVIKRYFYYKDKELRRWIKAYPYNGFKVKYTVIYDHPFIGRQEFLYENSEESFKNEIAKARTFGFLSEVELLKDMDLIKGGSLDNALVFDSNGVVNKEGVRYKDEPVRHKVLDFIGDISLSEYPIMGYFDVFCSGHELNNLFLRELYKRKNELLECIDLNRKDNYKKILKSFKEPVFT